MNLQAAGGGMMVVMGRPPTDATIPDTCSAAGNRERPEGLPRRYRLLDVIGEGGMGRVYRAYDTTLGREVAIKLIEQDLHGVDKTQQRERFVREARAAARLEHPNIVAVHDVDPEAGWLAMELVAGESLRDVVARGASAPTFVRKVAEQVLSALDAAHAAGVVHRDIKPSNIMVDTTGKVTLVDFGVARLVDAELTRTGESLGTPAYMAPEQLRGAKVDGRTDLYGLGATLYELVSGERMVAFESPSAAALARLDSQCPGEPGLAHVIGRCLQADPNARFPSARDAALALAKHRRRIRWAPPAAIVIGAVAIVGVVWLTRRGAPPQDPRMAELFTMAQRGEPAKASIGLEAYLAEHPDDADALTLRLLADWWKQGLLEEADVRKASPRLRPAQRAMLHGILLMTQKRDDAAIAYLESAERDHPDSVEITYALGEARWHGQQLERGVADLERAYLRDPRWQMALHHVIELRLPRGEAARLRPLADKLRSEIPRPQRRSIAGSRSVNAHTQRRRAMRAPRSSTKSRFPSSTSACRKRWCLPATSRPRSKPRSTRSIAGRSIYANGGSIRRTPSRICTAAGSTSSSISTRDLASTRSHSRRGGGVPSSASYRRRGPACARLRSTLHCGF